MKPPTLFHELLRGKSYGRAIMNRHLSSELASFQGRILDIGGGASPSYAAYLPESSERIATDVRDTDGALRMDANDVFPFPDASFDGALALNMLYILEDPAKTLAEIRRVLKPGGRFLASFPFFFPETPEPHDYHRWTAEGVEKLLRQCGYEQITVTACGGPAIAFAFALMPGRGSKLIRLIVLPFILAWEKMTRSRIRRPSVTCFWLVSAHVSA